MSTWRNIYAVDNLCEIDDLRDLSSYAIQSQYSASEHMLGLMAGFQRQLEITVDMDLFYDSIFNIYTATGFGLDNWGRILAMGRTIEDARRGVSITLTDEYYRLLLLYKALANISSADAETLNRLLFTLVQTGIAEFPPAAYVLEPRNSYNWPMVIRWVFEGYLNDLQLAVFFAAGTLAKGAGVGWELYAIPRETFGFTDGWYPFNQAPFAPDDALISSKNFDA